MKPIQIKKSELKKLSFAQKEVLKTKKEKKNRYLKLKSATLQSKKESKLKITFESSNRGPFTIESSILVADKDYVILKGGDIIPTKSIVKTS